GLWLPLGSIYRPDTGESRRRGSVATSCLTEGFGSTGHFVQRTQPLSKSTFRLGPTSCWVFFCLPPLSPALLLSIPPGLQPVASRPAAPGPHRQSRRLP
ncbi:hypothetical protein ANANG_G00150570, partial [Anguilla anguilla]